MKVRAEPAIASPRRIPTNLLVQSGVSLVRVWSNTIDPSAAALLTFLVVSRAQAGGERHEP